MFRSKRLATVFAAVIMIVFVFSATTFAAEDKAKITLNKTSVTLGAGEQFSLKAKSSKKISFKSKNEKIAQVGANGKIKAVAAGKTTVTAFTESGETAKCKVTVKNAPKKVLLNKTDAFIGVKTSFQLSASFPSGSFSNSLTYSSDNPKIATVSKSGKVKGVSAGKVKIRVKAFNGKTAVCTVTVAKNTVSASLNKTSVTLKQGSSYTLKFITKPSVSYYKSVKYTSANSKIASVTSSGKIKAQRIGKTTVTAKLVLANNKKITEKCTVTVKAMSMPYVNQFPKYPTGCEGASACMLLGYYGYDISLDQMINIIPRKNITMKNGKRWGPDINKKFVGDPRGTYTSGTPGYGIFSPGLTKSLNKAIKQRGGGYTAKRISGCSFETMLTYLREGKPVLAWATYKMNVPSTVNSWYIDETGKYFSYPRGTHVMIISGYSPSRVTVVDPAGIGVTSYDIGVFEKRWNLLGKQAIVLLKDDDKKAGSSKKISATVTTEGLNLRKGPNTSYSVIKKLKKGSKVTITAKTGSWYKVSCDGKTGYVKACYIKWSGKTVSAAKLKKGAGSGYDTKLKVAENTKVTVTDFEGSWYKVKLKSKGKSYSGYIAASYVA